MKNINWKKRLTQALWLLIGVGTIVLLVAAVQRKDHRLCSDGRIEITGAEENMFVDEKDILSIINRNGSITGKDIHKINLREIETGLKKIIWIKNAELFFDNNRVLHVNLEERIPIARIFTVQNSSFYIDSTGHRMPLSDKMSLRVPIFTSFPSDKDTLSHPDSLLLIDVVKIAKYVVADSFWIAQIAQIDITPQATFELIPTIGEHVVEIGNADELEDKFDRLYAFYKQAWLQNGINKYERLQVQYNGQVVAIKRGVSKITVDSAKAIQALNNLMQGKQQDDTTVLEIKKDKPIIEQNAKDSVTKKNLEDKGIRVKKNNNKQNKITSNSLSVKTRNVPTAKPVKTGGEIKQMPKAVMNKSPQKEKPSEQ